MAGALPLPAYSFRATIGGQSAGFSEVSGLSIERETVTYTHGLRHWEGETFLIYPAQKRRAISLKRGVVAGDGMLFQWLVGADSESRPMDVSLVDASGAPRVTIADRHTHRVPSAGCVCSGMKGRTSRNKVSVRRLYGGHGAATMQATQLSPKVSRRPTGKKVFYGDALAGEVILVLCRSGPR